MTGAPHRGDLAAIALLFAAAACHPSKPTVEPSPGSPGLPGAHAAFATDTTPPKAIRSPAEPPAESALVAPPLVTAVAVSMFGDSVAIEAPNDLPGATLPAVAGTTDAAPAATTVAPAGPPPAGPVWDIDVRSHETRVRVTFYIDRFTGAARPRFARWIQRGGRYEPMIRAKLRAARLPEDLTYLALIESGYDPDAYSSAAAIGIWQLMTGTAQGTGLRVDWWIDERRDPVRSTDGAIKFLGWLDQQFGSLYLAAAAYNGGPGRVARGLTRYADDLEGRSGDEAYFALAETDYLRAETRDYVPKLIAAALVAKEPVRYGFTDTLDAPLAYDSVLLGPGVPLMAVAKAAGLPLAAVTSLNGQVLRGMTPPTGKWWVRVPAGSADGLDSAVAALPTADRKAFKRITLKNSATIRTLSRKYDITSRQLIWFNPAFKRYKSGEIDAGRTVLIPSSAALAAARDVPDPSIEKYGSSRRRTATHVVKKGETLAGIAARYGTSVATLKKYNGLKESVIWPGQVIIVRKAPPSKKKSGGKPVH